MASKQQEYTGKSMRRLNRITCSAAN